jgi:DNA-binding NtrC family response regulator
MKRRILVVDDQQEWIDFLVEELSIYDVQVAKTRDAVLKALRYNNVALVIANIRRLDVLQAIADEYPDTHIVVFTVSPTAREAATAYGLGASDYFTRSFNPPVILSRIEKALGMAQKRAHSNDSRPPQQNRGMNGGTLNGQTCVVCG